MTCVGSGSTGYGLMIGAFGRGTRLEGEVRVRDVLTVDVVDGRIQAVRIVRNPDKLAHL